MMEQPKLKKFKIKYRYFEYGQGEVIVETEDKEEAVGNFEEDNWNKGDGDESIITSYYDFLSVEEVKEEKEEEK